MNHPVPAPNRRPDGTIDPSVWKPPASPAPPDAGPLRRCGRCGRPAAKLYLAGQRPVCWRCDAIGTAGSMSLETKSQ